MHERLRAIAFDLDAASLTSLREALPEWDVEALTGATAAFLTDEWKPGPVNLLVVAAGEDVARTLELCRCLCRIGIVSTRYAKDTASILGPRGSLQTRAQRSHAALLFLATAGEEGLVESALKAGAHSCLVLPIHAKEVTSMLAHARAGNRPSRHTLGLDRPQQNDPWQEDGGEA